MTMKKPKIAYTRKEWLAYAKDALLSFLTGFLHLAWSAVLLVANLAMQACSASVRAIRAKPVVAVGMVAGCMAVAMMAVYMQMKTRLTTAEWQRDSLELRLDSVCEACNIKTTYSKLEGY